MASRDLHSNVELKQLLASQTVSTTQTSTSADLKGFDSAEFLISIGTISNVSNSPQPSWSFKLQDSEDNSTFADVVDSDLVLTGSAASLVTAPDSSSGVFLVVDSAAEDAASYRVGYAGNKRYCRVVGTASNSPGNTPLGILALLSHAGLSPTQDT